MKKLLSAAITIAMLLSMLVVPAGADTTNKSKAVSFVEALALMTCNENGDFEGTKEVTRAEFAAILAKALRIDTSNSTDMGYVDLNVDSETKNAINALGNAGIMVGVGENKFEPEMVLTTDIAYTVLLRLCGYYSLGENLGGYTKGYSYLADMMDISKISNDNSKLTRMKLAQMLYDMQDIGIASISISNGYFNTQQDGNQTFLTECMKLDRIKGRITSNGYTSLYSDYESKENTLVIDNKYEFKLSADKEEFTELLGQTVTLYYVCDDTSDDYEYAVGAIADTDEIVVIDFKDMLEYEGLNVITAEVNGKEKNYYLENNSSIVFNGEACGVIKPEYFECFEFGTIKLIKGKNSSKYDVVIIEAWLSALVSNVDNTTETLYLSTANLYNAENYLSSTDRLGVAKARLYPTTTIKKDDYDVFLVKNSRGERVEFENITHYTVVDICYNDSYVKIITSNGCISDVEVKGTSGEYIITPDTKYPISEDYSNAVNVYKPNLGTTCNIYLNSFGYVVWIDSDTSSATLYDVGHIIKVYESDSDEETIIKLLTTTGSVKRFDCTEKIKCTDRQGIRNSVENANLRVWLGNNSVIDTDTFGTGLIQYQTDADGKIKAILLPVENDFKYTGNKEQGRERLHIIAENKGKGRTDVQCYNGNVLADDTVIPEGCKIFFITKHGTGDESNDYFVKGKSYLSADESKYYTKYSSYSFEQFSPYASYVVLYDCGEKRLSDVNSLFMVGSIKTEWNDELDEPVAKISGTLMNRSKSIAEKAEYWTKNENIVNVVASATLQKMNGVNLKPGDLIRFYSEGTEIKKLELLYSSDSTPAVNNGKKGQLILGGTYGNIFGLSQNVGNYSVNTLKFTNSAYSLRSTSAALVSLLYVDEHGAFMTTTQDLTGGAAYDPNSQDYATIPVFLTNFPFMMIADYSTKTPSLRRAYVDELRSYYSSGRNCSRLLIIGGQGSVDYCIVFNDEI